MKALRTFQIDTPINRRNTAVQSSENLYYGSHAGGQMNAGQPIHSPI